MSGKKELTKEKQPPEQAEEKEDAGKSIEAAEETDTEGKASPQGDEKAQLIQKNQELLSRLMYLQADFENYQKRAFRERQDIITNAQEGLLRTLLPLLDDFDKAVEIAGENDCGVRMLRTKLLKILGESGLSEIPSEGQKFDPFMHDAVEFANDETLEHGTIKEVVRKGYRCNAKVLRPSLVIVVKNESKNEVKSEGEKNA